MKIITAEPERT